MFDGSGVLLRNSQRPDEVLRFTAAAWSAFLDGVVPASQRGPMK